jgi:hypothetical protein
MRRTSLRFLLPVLLSASAVAQSSSQPAAPRLSATDRTRLAEAFRLSEAMGDSVWPGWNRVPFVVLLVTPDQEFLVGHPDPTPDFQRVGYDSLLRSDVYRRPRVFSPTLLATFPAIRGVSTVVVGQAEHTGKTSSTWVLTLMHEHFHQLQSALPDYFGRVAALDLSGGDDTGMWMLNYPFPYDSAVVQERAAALWRPLSRLLGAAGSASRTGLLREYRDARGQLEASLSPRDYRYLAFQLWQEGVARYVEHDAADVAVRTNAEASEAFRALPDYRPYAEAAAALREDNIVRAKEPRLRSDRRVAFYSLGYQTAAMLDVVAPGWRRRYLQSPFTLDGLVP